MRTISAQIVGDNLKAEAVPLSFRLKDGGEEIRPAPMAYIPNLWQKIEDMLNSLYPKTFYCALRTLR